MMLEMYHQFTTDCYIWGSYGRKWMPQYVDVLRLYHYGGLKEDVSVDIGWP